MASVMSRRLAELRKLMKDHHLAAYIVPHQDAHNSEYISATDERISFISNFDGSAGTCVITPTQALLWTDGRYFNQASKQLPPDEWTLMKDRVPGTLKISEFLIQLGPSAHVGIDPFLTSVATFAELSPKVHLKSLDKNLVDLVWGPDQPVRSLAAATELDVQFTGHTRDEKFRSIREEMKKEKASVTLLCALDEIAWTLNMRGSDIDYNPVFFAYFAIEETKAVLFIEALKLGESIRKVLSHDKIEIRPYNQFLAYLKALPNNETTAVWMDPDTANLAVYQSIPQKARKLEQTVPVVAMKACKNSSEVNGARACHVRDGAAEVKWMNWLFNEVMNDKTKYMHHTEVTLADKLEDFRKEMAHFQGLSFGSISSFGPNAAIIHYHAKSNSCAPADPTKIYLIDSGGQYLDGTTDVTRTVHFGSPSSAEKDAFTRVLKGVIQLTLTKFPPGTTGPALDAIARHALWQAGLDYRHGTGHGVGAFLNVHEGPCGISPAIFSARSQALKTALKPGMILSNEPGYYEDGNFGIRIENLMVVVESETAFALNKDQKMLTFDTLTMIPIQRKLIDVDLLTDLEVEWLNAYHAKVFEKLSPLMNAGELSFLTLQTAPIVREATKPGPQKKPRRSSEGKV